MSLKEKVSKLGLFSIVMITVGSVDSVRNLPATALFGSSLIFFFVMAAFFFLLPSALVSAELSSSYTCRGGVYRWVEDAFGGAWGFLAIWLQWIENVIWYPTILSFVAATVGYLIAPDLAENRYFLVACVLVTFWLITLFNYLGMNFSAKLASFCTITGLVIPMLVIIALGLFWVSSGRVMQVHFGLHDMLPHFSRGDTWVSLTGIMLSFCGMEIATVHVQDVENPQRTFPRAMLYSSLFIMITLVLGALAIAVVLPHDTISLVAGLMQAFTAFFDHYHLHFLLPVLALMLVLGGIGGVNNWIIAPTRGLLIAAQEGHLPPHLQRENQRGAPVSLLFYQALIVSVLACAFLLMPSVNGSYWLLTVLAAQLYMLMYVLMFAAAIRLRFSKPHMPRPFKIGGGYLGIGCVAGAGLLGSVLTFVIGFIPPGGINVGSKAHYETWLISGLLLMCIPPVLAYYLQRPSWKQDVLD